MHAKNYAVNLPMERAMPNRDTQMPSYPAVEVVLGAIADWINKYRAAFGGHDEFGKCDAEQVTQTANDLGVPAQELRALAGKGPGGADLLQKMLVALKVDARDLNRREPGVMRDLQRLCVSCSDKTRCQHELAAGTAAEHFHDFCPNAYTLDALFEQKAEAVKH